MLLPQHEIPKFTCHNFTEIQNVKDGTPSKSTNHKVTLTYYTDWEGHIAR